jgi:cytoskeletal protein RodZ
LVIGGVASFVAIGLYGLWLWLALSALVLGSEGFRAWVKSQEGYRSRTAKLPLWGDKSPGRLFVSLTMYLLPLSLAFGFLMLGLIQSGRTFAIFALIGLLGLLLLHIWFAYGDKRLDAKAIGGSVISSLRFSGENKRVLGMVSVGVVFPLLIGLLTMAMWSPTAAEELPATEVAVESEPGNDELAEGRSGFAAVEYEEGSAETADESETASVQATDTPMPTYTPHPTATDAPTDTPPPTNTAAPTWTAEPTKGPTTEPTETAAPPPTATEAPTRPLEPTDVPAPVIPLVRVNAASVNLRDGPGTGYGVLEVAQQGDEYEVLGATADRSWFNVAAKNGLRFWLASSVVNEIVDGSTSRVGVAATIPAPPQPTSPPLPTATQIPPTAVPVAPTEPPPPPPPEPQPAEACTPGYSPCIPIVSDADCAGGSGNGPYYVQGPVTVTGSDPYDLDRDHDGIGCE